MPLPLLAVGAGMGVMSLAGGALGNRQANKNAEADARSMGVREAGIDFGAERASEHIALSMRDVGSARIQSYVEAEKASARAESDAKVSAATAGVDGQSVDATINETKKNELDVKNSIDDQVKAQQLQLATDYVDTNLNAELSKGSKEISTKSSKTQFLEGALSFGKGFLSGYGTGV